MRLINFADAEHIHRAEIFSDDFLYDQNSKEYFIDLSRDETIIDTESIVDNLISSGQATSLVFYDLFHADPQMNEEWAPFIKQISTKIPVQWITVNKLPIQDVATIHYDFYWNRCKSIHLDGPMKFRWKNNGIPCSHYALHWQVRSHQYLAPVNNCTDLRNRLLTFLKKYSGFYSNKNENNYLETDSSDDDGIGHRLGNVPVARHYYDNSYVSCQVESQCLTGGSIVISEKTYDHLIQGRLVLNFGPQYFYRTLQQQGWNLWNGIDLSWDSIADDQLRWQKYIECLRNLLDLNSEDLHDIFLLNKHNIEHNWQMLYNKPYDYIH
jgi:hypothetical protein